MSNTEKKDGMVDESHEDAILNDKNPNDESDNETKNKTSPTIFYKLQFNELKELLEKEKQNSAIAVEKWKHVLADYQNLEKRTEKEIIDRVNTKTDKLILDFLNVYENFLRAKEAYLKDGISVEGLVVIIKNMESLLLEYEIGQIDTVGKIFDPNLHEAVSTINDQSLDDNTITKEITKGYISRNRVIRASKVIVSKKNQIKQ